MSDNRLNVISSGSGSPPPQRPKETNPVEAEARFERQWLTDPEQFDPYRNIKEKIRIERTWELIQEFADPHSLLIVDLGSGWGEFSKRFANKGNQVHAVDISSLALKRLDNVANIVTYKQYIPRTKLKDDLYDVVLGTDIIAYLPNADYRLFISEMARLVKPHGIVVCSTPIDINSEDALYRFNELAETDFKIEKWRFGYHRLWIRIRDFFEAPRRLAKASQNPEYRQRELKIRYSLSRWWFEINSGRFLGKFWSLFQYLSNPFANFVRKNQWLLLKLETVSKLLWDEEGISHAIFVGRRRPLIETPKEDIPIERKGKRQVWE